MMIGAVQHPRIVSMHKYMTCMGIGLSFGSKTIGGLIEPNQTINTSQRIPRDSWCRWSGRGRGSTTGTLRCLETKSEVEIILCLKHHHACFFARAIPSPVAFTSKSTVHISWCVTSSLRHAGWPGDHSAWRWRCRSLRLDLLEGQAASLRSSGPVGGLNTVLTRNAAMHDNTCKIYRCRTDWSTCMWVKVYRALDCMCPRCCGKNCMAIEQFGCHRCSQSTECFFCKCSRTISVTWSELRRSSAKSM